MLKRSLYIFTFLLLILAGTAMGQCPVNIGFDNGDFTNWEGATGTVDRTTGAFTFTGQTISKGLFNIISRAQGGTDPFAGFALTSPNGSKYVAQLGNTSQTNKVQRLTYTFTVPNDNFSLIYYYAVVLEDPNGAGHTDANKPKFTAAIYDVDKQVYNTCGSFNFVSIGNLPGFTRAANQGNTDGDVYFKSWSPVTIDLHGYAGKTLRLEFTTNNCGPGKHFAYAYLDVNQNCTSPISGNAICGGNNFVNLQAPSGFAEYHWYKGTDLTHEIANTSTYTATPAAVGDVYSVTIVPFPGLGCQETISTTLVQDVPLTLSVLSELKFCGSASADIGADAVHAGSDPSFTYTYYTDAACTNVIPDENNITQPGDYYIKATPPSGCAFVKKITISYLPTPKLKITNPPEVCANSVDITAAYITAGSTLFSPPTYWVDAAATQSLQNPDKVTKSGTYYIKALNVPNGCFDIEPVTVLINDLPVLKTNPVEGCNTADITTPAATTGSTNDTYTYWKDANATISLTTPNAITVTGTYYIKATTAHGCTAIAPIQVNVYPYPNTVVTDPPAVVFPETVDISQAFTREPGTAYYFYIDQAGTQLVANPTKISKRGTYYIKAVNGNNCSVMFPVIVTITPPPPVDFGVNTFTPNGDNKNDVFRIKAPLSLKLKRFSIYSPWGSLLFETTSATEGWDGNNNGQKMPAGTYYWIFEGYDTYTNKNIKQSGSVSIVR